MNVKRQNESSKRQNKSSKRYNESSNRGAKNSVFGQMSLKPLAPPPSLPGGKHTFRISLAHWLRTSSKRSSTTVHKNPLPHNPKRQTKVYFFDHLFSLLHIVQNIDLISFFRRPSTKASKHDSHGRNQEKASIFLESCFAASIEQMGPLLLS